MVTVKSEQTAVISRRSTAREPILEAAGRVIAEMGSRHMTLDAVAREAGVSKGGLLYHFPSKEALLAAMVENFRDRLIEAAPTESKKGNLALLRALITYRIEAVSAHKGDMRTAHGMIAAVAERPSLVEPLAAYYRKLWERVKQGPEPDTAILSWLALEGLLFLEVFNTSPFDAAEREQIIARILALLDETGPKPVSAASDAE